MRLGPVREGGCLLLTMDSDSDVDLDSSENVQQSSGLIVPLHVFPPYRDEETFLARELARRRNDPTKLHTAANTGDFVTIRRLLAEGLSPDHRSESGVTPLHRVCKTTGCGGKECFRLLRDAGADLEATTGGGFVPLHYAAGNRRKSFLVSMLIEAGVNVNVSTSLGTTPLHYAAKSGSETTVAMLVKAGAAVNAKDASGSMPLHNARDYNNPRSCPILLRAGAELVRWDELEPPPPSPFRAPNTRNSAELYLRRVTDAGGFKKYEQAHLARITKILAPTPRLPPEMVRNIVEFWLHAGYY